MSRRRASWIQGQTKKALATTTDHFSSMTRSTWIGDGSWLVCWLGKLVGRSIRQVRPSLGSGLLGKVLTLGQTKHISSTAYLRTTDSTNTSRPKPRMTSQARTMQVAAMTDKTHTSTDTRVAGRSATEALQTSSRTCYGCAQMRVGT